MPSQQDLGYGPGIRPPDYSTGRGLDVWVGSDQIVEVEAPDGTIVEFPAGTSPEVMQGAMAAQFGGPSPSQMRANADAEARGAGTPDALRAVTQGILLNYADEVDAYGAKLETMIGNSIRRLRGEEIPYTSDEAKEAVLNQNREAQEQFAADHPWINGGLQIAGGILTPGAGLAGNFIGKGASLGGRALRSAGVGAMYGAGGGAGASDGNLIDRAGGAAEGALLGSVVGGAMPAIVSGAGSIGRGLNAATGGHFISPERQAANRIADLLARDNVDDIGIAAANWRKAGGSDPTLMDLAGENTRAAMRAASSLPGDARNQSVSYVDQLIANLQDNGINRARELTPGETRTADEFAAALDKLRGKTADDMYPQFQGDRLGLDQSIRSAISGDAGREALAFAHKIADARRDEAVLADLARLAKGDVSDISAGTTDLIRRGLNEAGEIQTAKGNRSIGAGLFSRAADLEQSLMQSPGFDAANSAFAGFSRQIDAVGAGRKALTTPPDVLAAALENASADTRLAAQVGGRQAITDALGGPAEGATGVMRKMATSTNSGRNLETLYGDEGARFRQSLAQELERVENARFISPNTGAQTEPRASDKGLLAGLQKTVSNAVTKLMTGATLTAADRAELVKLGLMSPEEAAGRLAPRANRTREVTQQASGPIAALIAAMSAQ